MPCDNPYNHFSEALKPVHEIGGTPVVIGHRIVLWQLRFGVDPQGVAVSRDGLLDLLGWIGTEGGKIAVGSAEVWASPDSVDRSLRVLP